MSFPRDVALLAQLARIPPEERARLAAFRETFLVRLTPQRLESDLRHLGIFFGLLVEEVVPSIGTPGWPAGLRAAGADLHATKELLLELARDLLAVAPAGSSYHRRAGAIREIAGEIGRLADRLESLRPRRGRRRGPKTAEGEG